MYYAQELVRAADTAGNCLTFFFISGAVTYRLFVVSLFFVWLVGSLVLWFFGSSVGCRLFVFFSFVAFAIFSCVHVPARPCPAQTRIREVMIQGILATEMSEHGTHITKVDKLTNDFPDITLRMAKWASGEDIGRRPTPTSSSPFSSPPLPSMPPPSMETQGSSLSVSGSRGGSRTQQVPGAAAAALGLADCDRLTVASALLHAADLSSPGRPFATCKVWVLRLLDEFKFQAEQVCILYGILCFVCVCGLCS